MTSVWLKIAWEKLSNSLFYILESATCVTNSHLYTQRTVWTATSSRTEDAPVRGTSRRHSVNIVKHDKNISNCVCIVLCDVKAVKSYYMSSVNHFTSNCGVMTVVCIALGHYFFISIYCDVIVHLSPLTLNDGHLLNRSWRWLRDGGRDVRIASGERGRCHRSQREAVQTVLWCVVFD